MKIAIAGCTGRMGLTLVDAVSHAKDMTLVTGSERAGFDSAHVQSALSKVGISSLAVTSNAEELVAHADALIDFTAPDASLEMAKAAAKKKMVHIIGTTGFSAAQLETLRSLGSQARIVQSGNFSLGVTLLTRLVEQAAAALDPSYDIEIYEMHHKHKKDAPSGTALLLGEAAARGRTVALSDVKATERDGERKAGDIGFSVSRGGDVVGVHRVTLAGSGEVIELAHQGFNRAIYANGALHAARWAIHKKPGFYTMQDVIARP